jgi:hypothetical protein
MKLVKNTLLVLIACSLTGFLQAQNEAPDTEKKEVKKMVIIKKTIDENGDEVVEKIVKEGDDFNWESDDKVEVIVPEDGEDVKVFRVKGSNINKNVEINEENGKKVIRVTTDKDGDKDVRVWVVEPGEELPEEALKSMDHNIHFIDHKEVDPNQGFLGVVMNKKVNVENNNGEETKTVEGVSDKGALISEVVENSAAEAAGLEAGDIITSLDGNPVADFDALAEYLSSKKKGDKVDIAYLRNDRAANTTATLKGGEGKMKFHRINIEKEVSHEGSEGDEPHVIVIEKEIEEGEENGEPKKIIIIKTISTSDEITEEIEEEIEFVEEEVEDAGNMDTSVEFERNLQLEAINLFPNPSNGWVQVKFMADAEPTIVRFTDINGKEIYKQEMPDFDGVYEKAIDLNKAAKGTVFFTIQQGDKVYSDKIVLN